MKEPLVQFGSNAVPVTQLLDSKGVFASWTCNRKLVEWIVQIADLCAPEKIRLCDGSLQEYEELCGELVRKGLFIPLNPEKRPGSYACRSDPKDVARVEECTFICSHLQEDAGPTNNWKDPGEMKKILKDLFTGSMRGRTLYVIPFCMGPLDSPFSLIGFEITDSAYVVCSMRIMTRIGMPVLQKLGEKGSFMPCVHSVGMPLNSDEKDVPWPCNSQNKYIVHFPEEQSVWSFGSGYGGNALLGKKSIALRIASVLAKKQGWMAEHMLIIGITNPDGVKKYIAAAFPSQCGKTNLALLSSALPGWKVECLGDDIAWIRVGKDGRLYALNPEAGFFGVAPGTSYASNKYAMETIARDTIFTNVALTEDNDVWWEGMTARPPKGLVDWTGNLFDPTSGKTAAHPNARFTVSAARCPIIDSDWQAPEGVPLSAVLFGGRRAGTVPLIYQSLSWAHGVLLGACISSETTAAASGEVGKLRHDPFAMLPFCGYHMGDYFSHWLSMEQKASFLPAIFYVNWFRKDKDGKFVWPGFGDNIRVLKWVFERTEGKENYKKIPIGLIPSNLDLSEIKVEEDKLFNYSSEEWLKEVEEAERYFSLFGSKLPALLTEELQRLKSRIAGTEKKSKLAR